MGWSIQLDEPLGIIEIRHDGAFTTADMKAIASRAIALSKETGVNRFLMEFSEVVLIAPLYEILEMPATRYQQEGLDRRSRIALVRPQDPDVRQAAFFYERVCLHHRWCVRLFEDRRQAMDFLLNPMGEVWERPWSPTQPAATT